MNKSDSLIVLDKIYNYQHLEQQLAKLKHMAVDMTSRAGQNTDLPHFQKYPSLIPATVASKYCQSQILIDIGGTSTKVGLRLLKANTNCDFEYRVLFEDDNNSFNLPGESGNSLERFAKVVAARTLEKITNCKIDYNNQWALALVWSNALNSFSDPRLAKGVLGNITKRENYTKNEWFNVDTKNGLNIILPFISAFEAIGIKIQLSLVANDTPLTMKALPEAHAGMVASTGTNCTLVDITNDIRTICNAEMGTSFQLPSDSLLDGDQIDLETPCRVIEQQISGKYLPRIFYAHLDELSKNPQLNFLSQTLDNIKQLAKNQNISPFDLFQAEDVGNLTFKPEVFLSKYQPTLSFTADVLTVFSKLSHFLVARSAKLSAILAFASVANQLAISDQFIVALDSRLAREIPLFWDNIRQTLKEICPQGKQIHLRLIDRMKVEGGAFSVPMIGAANALDSLI